MNFDKILSAVTVRILNSPEISGQIENVKVAKGATRPAGSSNPYFTAFIPSAPMDKSTTAFNGTLAINGYFDKDFDGADQTGLMGAVANEIFELFNDKPLQIEGYVNYEISANDILGPLTDPGQNEESFFTVRFNFGIIKET